MGLLGDIPSRSRRNQEISGVPQQEALPSPQATLLSSAFLRQSRDFYDFYEDIQEKITGQDRELDKATLFESMVFFLFVLDFDLFHSKQTDKTNDYIFLVCERFVIHAYTGYKGTRFGSPQQIHNSIQCRLRNYAEFLRGKDPQDPVAFFAAWHNPVVNNMEAARGGDTIPDELPIVIQGTNPFDELLAIKALMVAYLATVCPFHFGLQELFYGNKDFLQLSEEEVRRRLSRGAAKAQERQNKRV